MTLKLDSSFEPKTILEKNGRVRYYESLFSIPQSDGYYQKLFDQIQWRHDQVLMFGKLIETKRKVAWYAEKPFEYTYSHMTKKALLWNPVLLELKEKVETLTGETFNSCLLNLYHDGREGVSWHSDGEKDLKKNGTIASLSFGAMRRFSFKHKESKEVISLNLEHGSLLLMEKELQSYWLHQLPLTKKVQAPRINLTFRTIVKESNV